MTDLGQAESNNVHRRRLGGGLPLLAVVLFGLSVRAASLSSALAVLMATTATGAILYLQRRATGEHARVLGERHWESRLVMAVVLFGVLGVTRSVNSAIGPTSEWLERLPGAIWALLAMGTYAFGTRWRRGLSAAALVLTLSFTLAVGLLHISMAEGVGLDVLFLHVQAADAIAEGHNPYTDVVQVPNGSPTAQPGDLITGYVYPPVTAIGYAAGEWLFSDPRLTSLVAWLGVLAILGISAIRSHNKTRLYLMLLLASLPGWPIVLRASWSEPLTLLFIALAWVAWRRPGASGSGLGLALASKQYFIVNAPLLLLHRDTKSKARFITAVAIVIATVGAALLLDLDAYWSSTVAFHASTPPRPDSSNLVGLLSVWGIAWDPPFWLGLGVGTAAAVAFGRGSKRAGTFLGAMAVSLSAAFIFSSQAFANYWFLIFGMMILSLADLLEPAN